MAILSPNKIPLSMMGERGTGGWGLSKIYKDALLPVVYNQFRPITIFNIQGYALKIGGKSSLNY